MVLKPLIPQEAKLNLGIIMLNTSVLHGLYSGDIVLDNGEKIHIDEMLGHAEDIYWKW